jgi:hypothetical protein
VSFREFSQDRRAGARQGNDDLAVIGIPVLALHQTVVRQPVNQLHGAVMPNEKPPGKLRDRRLVSCRNSANRQQKLVLARFNSVEPGLIFAEAKEAPDLKTKLG